MILASNQESPVSSLFRALAQRPSWVIIALLFVASALLNTVHLFPYPYETNQLDYPRFLYHARRLMNGLSEGPAYVPGYSVYPLVEVFYAILYIPFHKSPDWLTLTGWLGRVVIFAGLWVSTLLLARQIQIRYLPVAAAVVLCASPVFFPLLGEGPHGLFPMLAALALWQTLMFSQTGRLRQLFWASTLLGLTALTHTDGFLLFGLFVLIAAPLALTRFGVLYAGAAKRAGVAAVLVTPFALLLGGYFALYTAVHGSPLPDMAFHVQQSYDYFEISELVSPPRFETAGASAAEARRLYGTAEENGRSVLRAIMRNPEAAAARVLRTLGTSWSAFAAAYGQTTGVAVLAMLGCGIFALWRNGRRVVCAMLVVWALHLGLYALFYLNEKMMAFGFYVVVVLAGVGGLWLAGLLAKWRPSLAPVAAPALAGMLVITAFPPAPVSGFALRWPTLGTTSEERVSYVLQETQARRSLVASLDAMVPNMSKMEFKNLRPLAFLDMSLFDRDIMQIWLARDGIDLIYLNPDLQRALPKLYKEAGDLADAEVVVAIQEADPKRLAACAAEGLDCAHRVLKVRHLWKFAAAEPGDHLPSGPG